MQRSLDGVLPQGESARRYPPAATVRATAFRGVRKCASGHGWNGIVTATPIQVPSECCPLRAKRRLRRQRTVDLRLGSEIPQEHCVVQGPSLNDAVCLATRACNEFYGLARAVAIDERL